MVNTNGTSLQVIQKNSFFDRIVKFVKNVFRKKNIEDPINTDSNIFSNDKKQEFLNNLRNQQDPDRDLLLKIQNELEKRGINKENAKLLTKDLSSEQKTKLENLYIKQIADYEKSIKNYKNKIIEIRKQVG
jgi:hypothetical protein